MPTLRERIDSIIGYTNTAKSRSLIENLDIEGAIKYKRSLLQVRLAKAKQFDAPFIAQGKLDGNHYFLKAPWAKQALDEFNYRHPPKSLGKEPPLNATPERLAEIERIRARNRTYSRNKRARGLALAAERQKHQEALLAQEKTIHQAKQAAADRERQEFAVRLGVNQNHQDPDVIEAQTEDDNRRFAQREAAHARRDELAVAEGRMPGPGHRSKYSI